MMESEYWYQSSYQLHWDKNRVKLYSRASDLMNNKYPGLAQRLSKLFTSKQVPKMVLDGELVPYDKSNGKILPFSVLQKMPRKLVEPDQEEEIPVKILAFDCLSIEEDDITDSPIENRKEKLHSLISGLEKDTEEIAQIKYEHLKLDNDTAFQELDDLLQVSKKEGFEGLVVKPTGKETSYVSRSRSQWIKIKALAKEGDQALDTLDLVVMGVYNGSVV